ncbi:hypothetical protein B7463_g5528, partial [Scytalidium lignicola]
MSVPNTEIINQEAFTKFCAIDDYICHSLLPKDTGLELALETNASKELPPIDVAPNQGKLLYLLAKMNNSKRILEIGTLGGYSTIWLAKAIGPSGKIVTLELEPMHASIAKSNIDRTGFSDVVDVKVGPALETLEEMDKEGAETFDFVFIDADKKNNVGYFNWALQFSRVGTVIVVDNVVRRRHLADEDSRDDYQHTPSTPYSQFYLKPRTGIRPGAPKKLLFLSTTSCAEPQLPTSVMPLSQVPAAGALALLAQASQKPSSSSSIVFSYQTFVSGEVKTTYTIYAAPAKTPGHTHHIRPSVSRYIADPEDFAYPTFTTYVGPLSTGSPAANLPNVSVIAAEGAALIEQFKQASGSNCQTCKQIVLGIAQRMRIEQEMLAHVSQPLCEILQVILPFAVCVGLLNTASTDIGGAFPQMNMLGDDGQTLCAFMFGSCDLLPPPQLDLNKLFKGKTQKPAPRQITPTTKEPKKVLHISDYHLDMRFVVGSEANCTGELCCRVFPETNVSVPVQQPASLFGNYLCDTPEALGTSVFRNVPKVTGFTWDDFDFGLFTGDLVSHDIWYVTEPYVLAEENISFQQFFDGIGGLKIFPTLGNHDTFPHAFTAFPNQHLPDNASYAVQQLYHYDNVSAAWQNYDWLSPRTAQQVVNSGLGIYRAKTHDGLTIISLNSDVWYYFNMYAYIGANTIDPTSTFSTLIDYLLEAEENNDPVWLIQHVITGGSTDYEALPAPTDLYYQIVDRFNNTIRATFFGHTHADELGVFYANNGTIKSADTAVNVAYIMPSVTPYTNLNAGFRYYLVDPDTFDILDSITYYANVSNAEAWTLAGDAQWEFEYSARQTYDPFHTLEPGMPLTPAWWHNATELIATNATMFQTYTDLRTKKFRPQESSGATTATEGFKNGPAVESGTVDSDRNSAAGTSETESEFPMLPFLQKLLGRINVPAFWVFVARLDADDSLDDKDTLEPDAFPNLQSWLDRGVLLLGQPEVAVRVIDIGPDGMKFDRGGSTWEQEKLEHLLSTKMPLGKSACRVIISTSERGRLDRGFLVDAKDAFQFRNKPGFDLMRLRELWAMKRVQWQPFIFPAMGSRPPSKDGRIIPEAMSFRVHGQDIFLFQQSWVSVQTIPLEDDRFIFLCSPPARKFHEEDEELEPSKSFLDLRKDLKDEMSNGQLSMLYEQFYRDTERSYRDCFERLLLEDSATIHADGDPGFLCQLLLLDLFRAGAEVWTRLQRDWDIRSSSLPVPPLSRQMDLAEVKINIELLRHISSLVVALDMAASHMLTALSIRYKSQKTENHQDRPPWLEQIQFQLKDDIASVRAFFGGFGESLQHQWSVADLGAKEADADNLSRLTLIATIFLPLTFSAGVLSMATRIKDLGWILYDYCGLVAATSLFVFTIYKVVFAIRAYFKMFFGNRGRPHEGRIRTLFFPNFWGNLRIFIHVVSFLVWVVVAASFITGMVGDIPKSVDVLKYGLPICGGLFLFCAGLSLVGALGLLVLQLIVVHSAFDMTTAVFKYIDSTSYQGKPWTKVDGPGTSFELVDRQRSVTSLRGQESLFSTENSGFAIYHHPSHEKEFTDDHAIRTGYYAEVEELLRTRLDGKVKKVVIFDHTIRRRMKDAPRQPVQQVHVDQTPQAAETRVRRHLPAAEAEELLKGRYAIINVWRPIQNPASDFPLAVIDWRSTQPDDFIKVDLLYPKRSPTEDDDDRGKETLPDEKNWFSTEGYEAKGETYSVAPNEQHKFYYVKDMKPEEVMFLKCFDSFGEGESNGKKGLATRTPHTAFIDPNTPPDAPGRQSIEGIFLQIYNNSGVYISSSKEG